MEQTVEIKQKYITKPSRSGLKYHLKTFGCQMNEYDSNRIYDFAKNINYKKLSGSFYINSYPKGIGYDVIRDEKNI